MDKITTIRLRESTKKRLEDFGKKGETFEAIIEKLLAKVGGK